MTFAAIVAVSGCAVAASSGVRAKPAAVISQASGTFQITNSRDGQAIFQAQGLAPGRSVTGTVQLSNTGNIAGDLGLHQLDVLDQPGANGGRLSSAVQLDVRDITDGSLIPVYAGQLGSLDTRATVRAMYEAFVAQDRAAIEPLLADAFHFTSPLDNRIDRATYFERCWPNRAHIDGFDFVAVVPGGNRVFVIYEGRTEGGGRFRNAEVCLFQGRQVVEVEVYFGWDIPHKAPAGGFVDPAPGLLPSP